MNNNPDKKSVVRFFAILATAAIVLIVINAIADGVGSKKEKKKEKETVLLYEPDYDYDIFEDEFYAELDKFITYTDGAVTTRIYNDRDAGSCGDVGIFWYCFFNDMILGNYENFNDYFTDKYLKENGNFDRFTMQQIYNIEVTALQTEGTTEDEIIYRSYKVVFSIRRNNGTVWRYKESNSSIPMYFVLEDNKLENTLKILSID